VEGHYGFALGFESANQAQSEQSAAKNAAQVEMKNVVLELTKQPYQLNRAFGVIDLIGFRPPMPRDVDYGTWDSTLPKKGSNCHQIALDSSMRRRIRAKLQHSHWAAEERK
jgi:hypothetical protein